MSGQLYGLTGLPSITEARRPLGKSVGGPQSWSGTFWEEKSVPLPGVRSRYSGCRA